MPVGRKRYTPHKSGASELLSGLHVRLCTMCTHTHTQRRRVDTMRSSTAAIYDSMQGALCMYGPRHLVRQTTFSSPLPFYLFIYFFFGQLSSSRIDWTPSPYFVFYSAFSRFACYVRFIRMRTRPEPLSERIKSKQIELSPGLLGSWTGKRDNSQGCEVWWLCVLFINVSQSLHYFLFQQFRRIHTGSQKSNYVGMTTSPPPTLFSPATLVLLARPL